jgi:hypothetical protein
MDEEFQSRGRMCGKGIGGWMWCKYCVHMCVNGKITPADTTSGMGEGG